MITLTPTLSSSSALLSVNGFSSSLSNSKPIYHLPKKKLCHRRNRNGLCRAEFSLDAPFTVAIGACMLSSLVLPVASGPDEDGDSAIDSTDARFGVMGIISFVPYFNWLSWVFAWLDTGKKRYAVYSLVYLAPYLRSNLSLSPEESWLPIASIIFCIVHIQLEASIRNGDIQGFQLFSGLQTRKKHIEEGETKIDMKLPSAQEHSKDETRQGRIPRKPYKDPEHLSENWDDK